MKTVSYAITVCDEYVELEMLLGQLNVSIPDKTQSEVVILVDENFDIDKINKIIEKYRDKLPIHSYSRKFNKDFDVHKNFLNSMCTKDYIFNIDADEIPSSILIKELQAHLENLNFPDLLLVPRINIVKGILPRHIKQWGWKIDESGKINWPDYQSRIFLNHPDIKWSGSVHETIVGYKTVFKLPPSDRLCLLHVKEISRQEKQNELYSQIQR